MGEAFKLTFTIKTDGMGRWMATEHDDYSIWGKGETVGKAIAAYCKDSDLDSDHDAEDEQDDDEEDE